MTEDYCHDGQLSVSRSPPEEMMHGLNRILCIYVFFSVIKRNIVSCIICFAFSSVIKRNIVGCIKKSFKGFSLNSTNIFLAGRVSERSAGPTFE